MVYRESRSIHYLLLALLFLGPVLARADDSGGMSFASPQAAGKALVEAARSENTRALVEIFGPDSTPLVSSGDDVADRDLWKRFVAGYETKHGWTPGADGEQVLEIGKRDWPFPVPLIQGSDGWHFDAASGQDEILNRRIGRNELGAIQACLSFVDAQREYRGTESRGKGKAQYARYIMSRKGKKDGLYWEAAEGEPESPLGPVFASARGQGYSPEQGVSTPYHGYFFRILSAQGTKAPGGPYDYVVDEAMSRGFALVAWPARYRVSGVMTFLVSHAGVVYEKDLGPDTDKIASSIVLFNPDDSWAIVPRSERAVLSAQ